MVAIHLSQDEARKIGIPDALPITLPCPECIHLVVCARAEMMPREVTLPAVPLGISLVFVASCDAYQPYDPQSVQDAPAPLPASQRAKAKLLATAPERRTQPASGTDADELAIGPAHNPKKVLGALRRYHPDWFGPDGQLTPDHASALAQ